MSIVIETKNLSKHFNNVKAVDNLALNVRKGDIYCFLGRNGAGKTTTINMLLGLIEPTKGEIEVFGEKLTSSKNKVLERVGIITDSSGFYPNLTAEENLRINAKLLGVQKNNAINDALETVGISQEKDTLVYKFSLGMRQKLGVARAIMHNPELLIMDEPTNGLDPVGIKEIRKLIKALSEKRKITVFMSSHILSEVQQLATTIGIIHKGRLLEEISIEELRRRNRKYIELRVNNESKAVMILEEYMDILDYDVHADSTIRIYSHYDKISDINKVLIREGVDVTRLFLSEDNLEDYFVKLTGGENIA